MTTTEVRKKIAESKEPKWFNSVEITIQYAHINFLQKFEGFSSIHKFLNQQIEGWEKLGTIPSELNISKQHFTNLRNRLDSFINNYHQQPENALSSHWRNEIGQLQNNSNLFTYDSPVTEFLIELQVQFPNYVAGAYHYIIGQYNFNTKDNFSGGLLAYEFQLKDHTEIINRRNKEKSSISRIRNDFRNQLSESEKQLTEHLANANKDYASYVKQIDEYKKEKEELFDGWYEKAQSDFNILDTDAKEKLSSLEETYFRKLQLSKPARYWQEKSTKYYTDANKMKRILLWVVGLSSVFLGLILMISPKWIFETLFSENRAAIIRWSLIFITLISLVVFTVRAITKIMFSSFHLARDAEERHTLTFFYLSLLSEKDSTINDEDRKLILQSLFSRAETGLLKDDSGPTMPNDFIGKLMNK
ncbi:MAG: DUF6161 domain-containing protein [Gillisia sp.]